MNDSMDELSRTDVDITVIGPDAQILKLAELLVAKPCGPARLGGCDSGVMTYIGAVTIVENAVDLESACHMAAEWIALHGATLRSLDAFARLEVLVLMGRNDGSKLYSFSEDFLAVLVENELTLTVQCIQQPTRPFPM